MISDRIQFNLISHDVRSNWIRSDIMRYQTELDPLWYHVMSDRTGSDLTLPIRSDIMRHQHVCMGGQPRPGAQPPPPRRAAAPVGGREGGAPREDGGAVVGRSRRYFRGGRPRADGRGQTLPRTRPPRRSLVEAIDRRRGTARARGRRNTISRRGEMLRPMKVDRPVDVLASTNPSMMPRFRL